MEFEEYAKQIARDLKKEYWEDVDEDAVNIGAEDTKHLNKDDQTFYIVVEAEWDGEDVCHYYVITNKGVRVEEQTNLKF